MAHRTTQRQHNLAAPDPPNPSIMVPTNKKHHRPNPKSTTKPHHHHHQHHHQQQPPHPDPTSTIQSISNQFSKLYANHKFLASLKGSNGHNNHFTPTHTDPLVASSFQPKAEVFSADSHTSCTALTKSSSQHERSVVIAGSTRVKENDRTDAKSFKKGCKKVESFEAQDIKKVAKSMSRSHESVELRKYKEEFDEVSKRPSVSLEMRRRSFCSSQAELSGFFSCNGVKVVAVDMPPFMQIHAVDCARKAHDSLEKFTSKTLAFTLKKEFDGAYGPAWHCIVGTSFGSFVTHSVGGFMYFSMDQKLYVLLFKTTVQRAE